MLYTPIFRNFREKPKNTSLWQRLGIKCLWHYFFIIVGVSTLMRGILASWYTCRLQSAGSKLDLFPNTGSGGGSVAISEPELLARATWAGGLAL